jgi:hypothetical protein
MKVISIIVALLWISALDATELTGRVVAIADGDTFTLLMTDKQQVKIFSQKTCATTEIQNIGRNIQLQRMKCLLRILSDTLIFVPLSRAIVPLFLGYGHNQLSSAVAGPPSLPWPKYPVTSQFD